MRKAWLEWKWIDKVPKIRLYSEPKRRVEWLTPEQVKEVLRELPERRSISAMLFSSGCRPACVKRTSKTSNGAKAI